jgi:hypothetical protein
MGRYSIESSPVGQYVRGGKITMTPDYTKLIEELWPTIMRAWEEHADKHPVTECDVVRRKVAAMPAKDYIDGLTDRTRGAAHSQFREITAQGGIMVFIRDSRNKVPQSHVFIPEHETEEQRPPPVG